MSASLTGMYDFIEAFRTRVPSVHPVSDQFIHEDFSAMRDADPAEVLRLMDKVRWRTARELRFSAENAASCGYYQEAFKLRRRADKFELAIKNIGDANG